MAADLTHFLLPSSRLPTDVTFMVSGKEVGAHKSFLAAAHPAFDQMFFGVEAGAVVNRVKVEGEVNEDTFNLFLRHMYGCKMEVVEITELSTLAELYSIASQFGQVELEKEVKERLRGLLTNETRGPIELVEVKMLLARHKVEELLPLMEEKVKGVEVGEDDMDGLFVIVDQDGPQSKMAEKMVARFLSKHCPSTRQLATFVATRSKQLLPAGALARILESFHKDGMGLEYEVEEVDVELVMKEGDHCKVEGHERKSLTKVYDAGIEDADDVKRERGKNILDQKETIMRFLAFTNFPEEMRDKMVENFFEQAI